MLDLHHLCRYFLQARPLVLLCDDHACTRWKQLLYSSTVGAKTSSISITYCTDITPENNTDKHLEIVGRLLGGYREARLRAQRNNGWQETT